MKKNQKLTIKEKLKLLVLNGQFTTYDLDGKISPIELSDGPNGIRKGLVEESEQVNIHCYPALSVLGNSWDREVIYNVGEAIASDCIDNNIDIILGPGINIKRTPVCGRNFEYFSEDAYLAGELASEYVSGCQNRGIGTCLKHFAANNREYDRLFRTSEVDLRTFREIYTKAFEMVIQKADPYSIMCSYNPVNGINASENEWLLRGILRRELQYEGVVFSDWGAVHNHALAVKASLDIRCPYSTNSELELKDGIKKGIINEVYIDESVNRILELSDKVEKARKKRSPLDDTDRYNIALRAAESGCVLLKNENGLLPIKAKKITVLGELSESPSYAGGGSAEVVIEKKRIKSLVQCIQEINPETEIYYEKLYSRENCTHRTAGVRVFNEPKGLSLAYDSELTILIVGDTFSEETESMDRTSIKLNAHLEKLICNVAQKTKKLVVVVEAGSAIDMTAWIDKVQAVVYTGFAGEAINEALANILTGKTNPSGRLSETFPRCLEDTPIGGKLENPYADRYKEGVFVGYRHYVTNNVPVLFPFGYGLSYSTFKYSNFNVKEIKKQEYCVSFDVENISNIDGAEVCQLYVDNIDMKVERPRRELRRFDKIYLKSGEKKKVSFHLDKDCFAYFNICYNTWHVDEGRYEIIVAKDVNTDIFMKKIYVKQF